MQTSVVAIIDVETTGINPERDRVIEFAVQKGFEKDAFRQVWRVNPGVPIPAQATAVHGITDADLADQPPFSALVPVIQKIFAGAEVIVGYNLEFDLRCIEAELKRHKAPPLDCANKKLIDPLKIWRHFEPRKLEDAVRRFVGGPHAAAHSAAGDVEATGSVLTGMLKEFGLDEMSWDEILNILQPGRDNWVGSSNHLCWKEGDVVLNFGKNMSRSLHEVIRGDEGYGKWILGNSFPPHVVMIVEKAQALPKVEFLVWVTDQFKGPS